MTEHPRKIRLDGRRFGHWTVLRQNGNTPRGGTVWLSVCDCGTERTVSGADLRNGKSTNCGCVGARKIAARNFRHGQSKTRLNGIWKNMLARARGKRRNYEHVNVCDDWLVFEEFAAWACKSGYRDDLTIERLDCAGNYSPENCTWADRYTQAQNRSITIRMPDGTPAIVVARKHGVPGSVYRRRIAEGWPIEQAVTWPTNKRRFPHNKDASGRFV